MKTSVKKSAIFVMMAALVVLSAIVIYSCGNSSSAQDMGYFQGDYAVTGTNTCEIAVAGYNESTFTPNDPSEGWFTLHGYILGIFSFHLNGKGEFRSRMTGSLQTNPTSPSFPVLSDSHFDYNFTYTVASNGVISFHVIPCAGSPGLYNNDGPHDGVISPDGQSLIVYCGTPPILLSSCGHCDDLGEPDPAYPDCGPGNPQLACGIQMQGFRIQAPFTIPDLPTPPTQ
jgi:hypothetical protein